MRRNFLSEQSNHDPRSSGVHGDPEISNFSPTHSGRRDTRGSHQKLNSYQQLPELEEDYDDQYNMYAG